MDSGKAIDHDTEQDKLTVAEAAARLGVTQDAVRKKITRHTIKHQKDEAGRVYVLLEPSKTKSDADQDIGQGTDQDTLVETLRDQVEYLREELRRRDEQHEEESRRKDHIIVALTQRIPELEAPRDAQGPQGEPGGHPGEEDARTEHADPQTSSQHPQPERRSWWRRIFGG